MPEIIRQSAVLPVSANTFYNAWLDSKIHSDITEKYTEIAKKVGSKVTLVDSYFEGTLDLMHMNKRIVHTLRSEDFIEEDIDSTLEVVIDSSKPDVIKVTLVHSNIPDGEGKKYRKVWRDNYISKMKKYFKNED